MQFNNVKTIREEKGLSQLQLSELSGVGRITICRLETGKLEETTVGTLTKLANALDVKVDDLIGL
ncbi:helix-turn-helix transcriptional regulator [Hominibacterium faecale]|uniref:helix-turn-helix transcriptional regulator n=1 Tax=Hominibacterium faecale TaxID=2839743 RepID=UPI0022B292F2|nr:helix-turn-helix transcriptional regulator [Hominibacterium faecale]